MLAFIHLILLNFFRAQLLENLRHIDGAPSVAQFKRPPDHVMNEVDEDKLDPDVKRHGMNHFFLFFLEISESF